MKSVRKNEIKKNQETFWEMLRRAGSFLNYVMALKMSS